MKNLKKLLAIVVSCITLCLSFTALAQNDVTVILDGKTMEFADVAPQIINDRTMVPLRAIFEELGATVIWNEDDKSILSTRDNTIVMMQIDNHKLFKNNDTSELDVPPVIVNDRTLVPLRAVAESFGCTVDWNAETYTVTITTN